MPISWTAELFQTTMDVCGVVLNQRQFEEISERMGEGFTVDALKHRFRRLKAQSGKTGGGGTPRKGSATPKANKTGATPKSSRSKKQNNDGDKTPRASPRKRTAKSYVEAATDDEDNDEEEPESPTKKVKQEQQEEDYDAGESFFEQAEEV